MLPKLNNVEFNEDKATPFHVVAPFEPMGDQPEAIEALAAGIENGQEAQVLLGATGTGKTFTIAKLIEKVQRPTLVIAHNKTLAAQLASEFKAFFPDNYVGYFVSYYDYYQPEAYIASTDTYIEKDASINDEIDELRHSATCSLFERRDVIIVASVSCIYGLGSPEAIMKWFCPCTRGRKRIGMQFSVDWWPFNMSEMIWYWSVALLGCGAMLSRYFQLVIATKQCG